MIVVKVGGSLFDHPQLGPGLRAFVEALESEVLLVAGGGAVADAVRELDRTHGLGEEAAHWLALRSLGVTGALLEALTEPHPPTPSPRGRGGENPAPPLPLGEGVGGWGSSSVLNPFTFALEDELHPDALPHTWAVTTDSIAARAAVVFGAERLVLLKSVDVPPGTAWEIAAANGWVDAHFPQIAPTLACPIEAVNFRRQLDARA